MFGKFNFYYFDVPLVCMFSENFDNPNKNSNESKYQLKAICEEKSKERKDAVNKVNYNTTNLLTPNRAVLR